MKRKYKCSVDLEGLTKIKVEKELTLGFLNLSEKYFDQAKISFDICAKLDPKSPDAYWGQMLCKLQVFNEDLLYSNANENKIATSLPECQKALEYADEELKKIYNGLLEQINKINEGDNF